jgi:hypothetical protein
MNEAFYLIGFAGFAAAVVAAYELGRAAAYSEAWKATFDFGCKIGYAQGVADKKARETSQ